MIGLLHKPITIFYLHLTDQHAGTVESNYLDHIPIFYQVH